MGEVAIRPFEEDDLSDVLELLRVSLGELPQLRRTEEWFCWKHFHNPFGRSLLLVADVDGRIAGLRAFLRWRLDTPEGETLQCVRPVDTATHPDFQRRGIFRQLTEAALDVAANEGVDLVFNTPNPRSGAGYEKMGWQEVGPIGVLIRPSWRLLGSLAGRGPSGGGGDHVLSPPGAVWPVARRAPRGLRTPRTDSYLTWRFADNPSADYRVATSEDGLGVMRRNVRRGRHELVVSELFGSGSRDALANAIRAASSDYLVGWFPPGTPERRAAIRAGMIPIPGLAALRLFVRPLRQLPLDARHPSAWDLSMGDLELL